MKDVVTVTGVARLGQDPEMRTLQSGTSVTNLRVVWNNSRKDGATGEWSDVPCWFDLTVFGKQAEACARFLTKGRQIVFTGRIEQRSWQDKDTNANRYAYNIIAEHVQFVGSNKEGSDGGGHDSAPSAGRPVDSGGGGDLPSGGGALPGASGDDEIPFHHEEVPSWDQLKAHHRE